MRAALWLSALTVGLAAIAAASGDRTWLNFASVIQICLLAVAMAAVLRRVVTTRRSRLAHDPRRDQRLHRARHPLHLRLRDDRPDPRRRLLRRRRPPQGSDFLFFSYTTLTTTGYGNLVPAGQLGRMVSGLEMMIGQIFLVTLVAGLVSLWRPGEALRRRRERRSERRGRHAPSRLT